MQKTSTWLPLLVAFPFVLVAVRIITCIITIYFGDILPITWEEDLLILNIACSLLICWGLFACGDYFDP